MTKSTDIPTKPVKLNWDADPFSLPESEPHPNKSMTIMNNTAHTITMLRLESSWESVNFAIESEATPSYDRIPHKKSKELATLYPGDMIELKFNEPGKIEK